MNTMNLTKEQFQPFLLAIYKKTTEEYNERFNENHKSILDFIYEYDEDLYFSLCKTVKNNSSYNDDVKQIIRIKLRNYIASDIRKQSNYMLEYIIDNWLDLFLDEEKIYDNIYEYLNNEQ